MDGIVCNTIGEFDALNSKVKTWADANGLVFDQWADSSSLKKDGENRWLFPTDSRINSALSAGEIASIETIDGEVWFPVIDV